MTRPVLDFAELQALLDALCEEALAPGQLVRLEELLLGHPEAEAYYVQYMSQHADVARFFAAQPCAVEQTLRQRLGETPAAAGAQQPALPVAAETVPSSHRQGWILSKRRLLWTGLATLAAALLVA